MRIIIPSSFQSTTHPIVIDNSRNADEQIISPPPNDTNGSIEHIDDHSEDTTAPTNIKNYLTTKLQQHNKLVIMLLLSLLLPLVGVYCMIIFHPWIEDVVALGGNTLASFPNSNDDASSLMRDAIGGEGSVYFDHVGLVEDGSLLPVLPLCREEDWLLQQEQQWEDGGQCSLSFVDNDDEDDKEEEHYYGESLRQIDNHHDVIDDEENDVFGVSNKMASEEESSKRSNGPPAANVSLLNDTIICVNCHALFRIHVDVIFQHDEFSSSTAATTTETSENNTWFITLRDVTTNDEPVMQVVQMDRPLDLRCDTITATVRRDDVCERTWNKGRCNNEKHLNLSKCQSNTIIEVPYSSFSTRTNSHEVPNERIILVSLLREKSNDSDSSNMIMPKKRRVVDQWMVNVVVPPTGGGVRSSIYSIKLRDMIKYDNIALDEPIKQLDTASGDSLTSPWMYDVIFASLVGALVALVILVIVLKVVVPQDEDDGEEDTMEEEEIMTTPGILALQQAMFGSNYSPAECGHVNEDFLQYDERSPHEYDESQSRIEESEEVFCSTPTDLSPLFDNEVDTTQQDDDDPIVADENTTKASEDVEESQNDNDEGNDFAAMQDQAQEDENAHDNDETAAAGMVDDDQDTPTTSNKSDRKATDVQRVSSKDVGESAVIGSPLFYSPRYQSNEMAPPLPHSNTSSVYDQVERVDGVDSNRVEPATMLHSNLDNAHQPPIDSRAEWSEFGAFVSEREAINADYREAATSSADAKDGALKDDVNNSALSCVSKRLFAAASKQTANEAVKASSIHDDDEEVDDSMFLPNVIVQAEANASLPNISEESNVQTEVIASPPKLHRTLFDTTVDLDTANKHTESSNELAEATNSPTVDTQANAGGPSFVGNKSFDESQQTFNPSTVAQAKSSCSADASLTSNKPPPVSTPSNEAQRAQKTISTPPTAPMSSPEESPEEKSPPNRTKSIYSTPGKQSTLDEAVPDNFDFQSTSRLPVPQQQPSSPSPDGSHHDLSYVNQSLSVSSSPSVTSAPRNSNSPSVTSDPHFSPTVRSSDDGSDEEMQKRKHRSLPFVSREYTSRGEKENAPSNARTPLSAKATLHSPSSTVAATVAEFAVPRKNGLAWRAERPVPLPSGTAGQNKRLGGSPEYFAPSSRGASDEVKSSEESIDFMNGTDISSKNDDSNHAGSSRSGKRSRSSMDSRKNKKSSRKRKTNVEKKLLATIKTSDKHKPPSGLSSLSQRLNEDMWEHS